MMLQPSTVSSSRPSQVFVITRKGENLWHTWQTLIPFQIHPQTPTHQICPHWNHIQCQAFSWICILCSRAYKAWYTIKSTAFATSMSFASATKANGLHFLSELPFSNGQIWKWIISQPYPMPSIHKLFKCIEGSTYCTTLDLNMGFWTIPLNKPLQCLCMIILPREKYCYLDHPMGLACL
jgi:hypothetical protein